MKPTGKKFLVLALACAMTAAPLGAQPVNPPDVLTNPTVVTPPVPPTPQAPPALESNGDPPTNKAPAKAKKAGHWDEHTPVRIGPTGIHIGGSDPVDIEMPNVPQFGHAESGVTFYEATIAIIGIIVPFVFLMMIGGLFFYSRNRRQRMLHETLRSMIEKGVPIPPELITGPERSVRRRAQSDLRSALVMLALGISLLVVFHASRFGGRIGWIPVMVGVAFLITWFIEKKDNDKNGANP